MERTVQKWGNSLASQLPKATAVETQISEGSIVDLLSREEGALVKAHRGPRYRLSELVAHATKKNLNYLLPLSLPDTPLINMLPAPSKAMANG